MTDREDPGRATAEEKADESAAIVRVVYLQGFPEVVGELGGDADQLLAKVGLDPDVLETRDAAIPYRTLVHLLERAAEDLECPDFGLRLAMAQLRAATLGPLGIAMRNAPTVGEAFRYCVEHVQVYSAATQTSLEDGDDDSVFVRIEILLARLPYQRQAVEHALLLIDRNVRDLSGGRVRAREICFTHEPHSPAATYRKYFDCPVHFACTRNAVRFAEEDLEVSIVDRDPQVYKLATRFVEQNFPSTAPALSARVRTIIERQLLAGGCTLSSVASSLGMHPRTLQRRLRSSGGSFEKIKDGVRRDMALRYLTQSSLPLMRIAEILGYSEASVLSRSCDRWFAASPRQLRAGRGTGDD